jgi:hypothetical protein
MYPLRHHPPDGGRRQHSMVVMAVQRELVCKGTKPYLHHGPVAGRAPPTHDLDGWLGDDIGAV